MRHCLLALSLVILLKTLLFAGGETDSLPDQTVNIMEVEEDTDEGWRRFFVDVGIQHLDIRFPVAPGVEDYGDTVVLSAVDTSMFPTAIYGISFHKEMEETSDPYELFEAILTSRSESGILLWHKISVDEDRYILDTITKSTINRVYRKDRVIATSQGVYFLFTLFFIGSIENHDYFSGSFSLRD